MGLCCRSHPRIHNLHTLQGLALPVYALPGNPFQQRPLADIDANDWLAWRSSKA